jgi:hypothetical protein
MSTLLQVSILSHYYISPLLTLSRTSDYSITHDMIRVVSNRINRKVENY